MLRCSPNGAANVCREARMGPLRSNFLPGLILGVGIGLLLGHLTVWRQTQNARSPRPLATLAPLKMAGLSDARSRILQERYEFSAGAGFDFHDTPEPLQNALALESVIDVNHFPKKSLIPVSQPQPQPTSEPQQLPVNSAAPLSGNSPKDQAMIRELIDLELSHLNPEQRHVWFESLKDVDKADAVGILKMWAMLGGSGAPLPPGDSPFPKPPTGLDHPAVPSLGDNLLPPNLVSTARALHRDNLLMANTPGFVPLVPVWYASRPGQTDEPIQLQYRLNLSEMKRVPTGFPLDVAIVGAGFFQVASAKGDEYFTRNGQFGLDEQLRICLTIAGQKLLLVPEVRLKGLGLATQSIQIQPSGEVILRQPDQDDIQAGVIHLAQPISSASLKSCGNGLFQLSEGASGQVLRSPPAGDGYSHLVQEELEFPIIDAEAETAAIDALGTPVN